MKKFTGIALLALIIAIIAPLWASLSSYFGLLTGAVALICAGLYVANGSIVANGLKITLGFLAGNFWGYFVVKTMGAIGWNISPYLLLFIILFIYAIVAVFIACYLDKVFDLSAWLAGWAVTLTILNSGSSATPETLLLQIGLAMIVGVWLIGVLITSLHKYIMTKLSK